VINVALPRVQLLGDATALPATTPILRGDDLGVLRGESVFETLRIVAGRPAYLEAHLARLAVSADRLNLELPGGWEALALEASNGVADGVLRLVYTRGGVGYALVTDVPTESVRARVEGLSVLTLTLGVTADARSAAPWLLGGVKSTSYAVNMASQRAAQALGADDAIWLSSDGWVLEAPTSTVVIVLAGDLVTPPVTTGILPGTTLAAVRDLLPVPERPISVAELAQSEEVMLLGSIRGVAPVVRLDGRELGIGPVTRALSERYEAALRVR
jgi:4-amino-4-deoxychorismate lyase